MIAPKGGVLGLVLVSTLVLSPVLCQVSFGSSRQINRAGRQLSSSFLCVTVDGPNPNARCVFPFIYNNRRYTGCPVDPDDRTKRWCSTKVDANGVHVGGQNQYGHCGRSCPKDDLGTLLPSRRLQPLKKCPSSTECRPIGVCALVFTTSELDENLCTQVDGNLGLCCSDIRTPRTPSADDILPNADEENFGLRDGIIPNFSLRQALDIGESFLNNVTTDVKRNTRKVQPATATSFHSVLQKARPGAEELNRVGIIAMEASRNLEEPGLRLCVSSIVGIREADVRNSLLERCYGPVLRCDPTARFRTIDGSCNNLLNPLFGKANTPLQRLLPNAYADGFNLPRVSVRDQPLPSARTSSLGTVGRESSPSAEFTALLMSFGQFVDHDLDFSPLMSDDGEAIDCCTPEGEVDEDTPFTIVECFPIVNPPNDPIFRTECTNFVRSATAPRLDCFPGPSEQLNQLTDWLDSSNVYGSTEEESTDLRSFRSGLLATSISPFRGALPLLPEDPDNEECRSTGNCFAAGDARVNEQPNLAIIHTIFVREHNRIARVLQNLHPSWGDDRLFLEARRIVNAEYQHIIYNEFLPIVLGQDVLSKGLVPLNVGFSNDYNNNFDPRVSNEFATAAYRFGHTLIPSLVRSIARLGPRGRTLLRDMFANIDQLRGREGVDKLIRGLVGTPVENVDDNFSEEVLSFLFDGDDTQLDLIALNVQRGREHGIPGYIKYREICGVDGGRKVTRFQDLSSNISKEKISRLVSVYQDVGDIDLFVGLFLEEPGFNGGLVGQTFQCLIADQFERLKKGDRFFYDLEDQAGSFTLGQLIEIRKVTFSRLICDNSDNIKKIQPLAFQLPTNGANSLVDCDSGVIPEVDLNVFA